MSGESIWKALADPTRRAILKQLKSGSSTAGELADAFPMTRASLSHHFNVLKSAGLVRTERRGQHIVYSLNTTVFEEAATMFMDVFGGDVKSTSLMQEKPPGENQEKPDE